MQSNEDWRAVYCIGSVRRNAVYDLYRCVGTPVSVRTQLNWKCQLWIDWGEVQWWVCGMVRMQSMVVNVEWQINVMSLPGFEPGLVRPQRNVLTTRPQRRWTCVPTSRSHNTHTHTPSPSHSHLHTNATTHNNQYSVEFNRPNWTIHTRLTHLHHTIDNLTHSQQ